MDVFTLLVLLLFGLALIDLSVGVSNDAVNFLNSAIGSQVASRRTILIIASFGILTGALFSSGMMEVARKGIFNPDQFVFTEVMIIFLAVMLADVLLLDAFNTFALPTSTTVSIVFELLGAAVALALVRTATTSGLNVSDFINIGQAVLIISGIFISVLVAFAVGSAVQWVSRALFSFRLAHRRSPLLTGLWASVSLTVISYFLFIKGLSGATFIPADFNAWAQTHTMLLTALLFAGWSVLALLHYLINVSILKTVVIFGTFSLAMAFASNDLVNFVGVPLAGLASWRSWAETGVDPNQLSMTSLLEPVRGDTLWLVAAGGVMIITLWLSQKARSVTETEVNLGRQDAGTERFRPGPLSRSLVGGWLRVADWVSRFVPAPVARFLATQFDRSHLQGIEDSDSKGPAFDLLRASVNLTVASGLIALATSFKLPLSTTYVSFMVAMGTSLADRAWGRDSAVYRVAGVLSVIGGWLITALVAFTVAGVFALMIRLLGWWVVGLLAVLVLVVLQRTNQWHRRRRETQDKQQGNPQPL